MEWLSNASLLALIPFKTFLQEKSQDGEGRIDHWDPNETINTVPQPAVAPEPVLSTYSIPFVISTL